MLDQKDLEHSKIICNKKLIMLAKKCMEIEVLRIGQRVVRDDRVTTHVALVARSFGAKKIYMNEINPDIINTISKINKTFPAPTIIRIFSSFLILDSISLIF